MVLPTQHLVADLGPRACTGARPGSRLVRVDVPHDDDLTLGDHHPVLGAGVVRGPLAAPAQRLDLEHVHPVGELDQARGAREQLGAEVGEDAEGEDVDLQLVDDPGELLDLLGRVELRLVTDQVVDPRSVGERVHDVVPEVEVVLDLARLVGEAEPARERRRPRPVPCGEDPPRPSARGVVVVGLQCEGRLPCVHRPGAEGQFSHPRILSPGR